MATIETIHSCCAGLDVHKESVVAGIRRLVDGRVDEQVRTFSTTTQGLLELADWLVESRVTIAAMESTGVYWKPVWNILEGLLELMLVNARHVKQLPGRKTDVKDCMWLAQLLSCGLLRASFVPLTPQRELRDLTRTRMSLMQDRTRVVNRLQKILEDANIKLASVASDVLGVSGRDMIKALIAGDKTPDQMAQLSRKRLRSKIPQLTVALTGLVSEHHRFMLRMLMDQIEHFDQQVALLDKRIGEVMSPLEQTAVTMLDEIPGIDRRAAENILAEIGTNMSQFPTDGHLAAWAGLCPGNNQSAGKRKSGRMTDGP